MLEKQQQLHQNNMPAQLAVGESEVGPSDDSGDAFGSPRRPQRSLPVASVVSGVDDPTREAEELFRPCPSLSARGGGSSLSVVERRSIGDVADKSDLSAEKNKCQYRNGCHTAERRGSGSAVNPAGEDGTLELPPPPPEILLTDDVDEEAESLPALTLPRGEQPVPFLMDASGDAAAAASTCSDSCLRSSRHDGRHTAGALQRFVEHQKASRKSSLAYCAGSPSFSDLSANSSPASVASPLRSASPSLSPFAAEVLQSLPPQPDQRLWWSAQLPDEQQRALRALAAACGDGAFDQVARLTNRSVPVNEYPLGEAGGGLPLHEAARGSQSLIGKYLIERCGADPEAREGTRRRTPLHLAAMVGDTIFCRYLVEHCLVSTGILDGEGRTPLHLAASYGHLAACIWLASKGHADVSALDRRRRTPLHLAARSGYDRVCEWLVMVRGGAVDGRDARGQTALHLAAAAAELAAVASLCRHCGADPSVGDALGRTPLMHAAMSAGGDASESPRLPLEAPPPLPTAGADALEASLLDCPTNAMATMKMERMARCNSIRGTKDAPLPPRPFFLPALAAPQQPNSRGATLMAAPSLDAGPNRTTSPLTGRAVSAASPTAPVAVAALLLLNEEVLRAAAVPT